MRRLLTSRTRVPRSSRINDRNLQIELASDRHEKESENTRALHSLYVHYSKSKSLLVRKSKGYSSQEKALEREMESAEITLKALMKIEHKLADLFHDITMKS